MSDTSHIGLRKADFWTSLGLFAIGGGMLAKALSMPLEGTYAGVTNAWYVSPALFPIIVAVFLILLAGILLVNAVRTGGARAAWQDLRGIRTIRAQTGSEDLWIVGGTLAGYIYIFIPRADFIAATTLLLFTLVSVYDLQSTRVARRALFVFSATAVILLVPALLGYDVAPQSTAAFVRDAIVWAAVAVSMAVVTSSLRSEPGGRSRLVRCIGVSVLTPLILGAVFKYGLLVPLPNEGLTIVVLDWIRYGVPTLFQTGVLQ